MELNPKDVLSCCTCICIVPTWHLDISFPYQMCPIYVYVFHCRYIFNCGSCYAICITLLHESSLNMPLFLISHAHCSVLHKRMFFWKAFHPSLGLIIYWNFISSVFCPSIDVILWQCTWMEILFTNCSPLIQKWPHYCIFNNAWSPIMYLCTPYHMYEFLL